MKLSIFVAAALAASIEAAVLEKKQWGEYPDVEDCGLDAFDGHTSEALLFCSSILRSGTATATVTSRYTTTTTTTRKITTTVRPTPSVTPQPTPTPSPTPTPTPSSSPKPSSSSAPKPSSSSTVRPSSSAPKPSSSATPVQPSSTLVSSPSPTPTGTPSCGIVAYVKTTPAYYFESSGTKNTFAACSALCKADSKCLSFGYGEANCMLFDVPAADNTNYNPMSPYTFYDISCPAELPVRKRQLDLTIPVGGIHISLGLGGPREISSACSCFIGKGPASTTVTRTASSAVIRTSTATSVVTRTRDVGAE